jgi:hypothetical protein
MMTSGTGGYLFHAIKIFPSTYQAESNQHFNRKKGRNGGKSNAEKGGDEGEGEDTGADDGEVEGDEVVEALDNEDVVMDI